MAVKIKEIDAGSPMGAFRVPKNASLVSINGHEITDVLDYGFYAAAERLTVEIRDDDTGKIHRYRVKKDEYRELGISSQTFLMDAQRSCANRCVFCFIDQLPPGLRESLYFKDDDARLSFLFGNYITMTNMSDSDVRRIIDMHISPVNVSVHTTDPELRCRVMGNRFAGEKLKYLKWLCDGGIDVNCQVVICRGLNDGQHLKKTLRDLVALGPSVRSVAVVPAGLTAYREGLTPLEPFDRESSAAVLSVIDAVRAECVERGLEPVVYPADELLLTAGAQVPPVGYYGELLQLENGVGMLAVFEDEFSSALALEDGDDTQPRECTVITGEAAFDTVRRLCGEFAKKFPERAAEVLCVKNNFFGGNVSVSGLLTAADIIEQTSGRTRGRVVIPRNTLRAEGDMFLDSVTLDEFAAAMGAEVRVCEDGADLVDALAGR